MDVTCRFLHANSGFILICTLFTSQHPWRNSYKKNLQLFFEKIDIPKQTTTVPWRLWSSLPRLEDHRRTCKQVVYAPFIRHEVRLFGGVPQPQVFGTYFITMVMITTYIRPGWSSCSTRIHLLNPSPGWNFSNSRRRLHSADWPNQHRTFQGFALQWLWDPHQEPDSCPGAPLESSQTLNDMMIYENLHEFPWFLWVFMSVNIPVPWMDPMGVVKSLDICDSSKMLEIKSEPKIFSQMVGERMLMNPMVRIQSKRSHKKIQEVVIAGSVILGHLPKFQASLDLVASGERIWEWRKIGGWKTTFEVWLQKDVSIHLCSFAVHIKWRYQCCTLLCLMEGLPLLAQNSWKNLGLYTWGFP